MEKDLNLKATELRLGLPGTDADEAPSTAAARGSKRASSDENPNSAEPNESRNTSTPATKAQAVGWPPIRSYRKNSFHQQQGVKNQETAMYVKVSMDGAPYLRKIDINGYKGYPDLLKAMADMFKFTFGDYSETEGYTGSDYVPTYEDKDGDWMLVGDVPWEMFMGSCKRLRIMKGSDAKGLGCNV